MQIKHPAVAGTLESSDCYVSIEAAAAGSGLQLDLESSVMAQYGEAIRQTVLATLQKMNVCDAKCSIQDRGALDCTVKARVQTAVLRASDAEGPLPWGTEL